MMRRKSSSIGIAAALTAIAFILTSYHSSNALADDAASDQEKIAAGENVYNTRCAICHGDDLVNSGQTFDLRRLKANERPRFDNSVRNGKNQMPPWKGVLSDDEIDQLWHYIRAHAFQK
jgi:mono/diheme cytochrome c family protein